MLFPLLIKGIHSERGEEAFMVQHHLCYPSRVVRDVFRGDGAKKWAGVDGKSTLLEES